MQANGGVAVAPVESLMSTSTVATRDPRHDDLRADYLRDPDVNRVSSLPPDLPDARVMKCFLVVTIAAAVLAGAASPASAEWRGRGGDGARGRGEWHEHYHHGGEYGPGIALGPGLGALGGALLYNITSHGPIISHLRSTMHRRRSTIRPPSITPRLRSTTRRRLIIRGVGDERRPNTKNG